MKEKTVEFFLEEELEGESMCSKDWLPMFKPWLLVHYIPVILFLSVTIWIFLNLLEAMACRIMVCCQRFPFFILPGKTSSCIHLHALNTSLEVTHLFMHILCLQHWFFYHEDILGEIRLGCPRVSVASNSRGSH